VKESDVRALMKGLAPVLRDYLADCLAPIFKRLEELETKGLAYAGTWQRAQSYKRGSVVTHDGAAWVALRDTGEGARPGSDLDAWQLMVKSGRNTR
jgi:hypothetical protein